MISIDACRNELNLPERALGSGTKGFGAIPTSSGLLISFAADNNQTARDYIEYNGVKSANSPYAIALSEELVKPGRLMSAAFGAIRPNVLQRTGRVQQPVVTNKLNRDHVLIASINPTPVPQPKIDSDEADWKRFSGLGNSGLQMYLKLYPNGKHTSEAKSRLARNTPDVKPTPKTDFKVGDVFQDILKDGTKGPQMVVIPAGQFVMGSPENEEGRDDDEGPIQTVIFRKSFAVGKFEITWSDWEKCVSDNGCEDNSSKKSTAKSDQLTGDAGFGRASRPVINVNWEDAKSYVRWLSAQTGETYRLLSEAEWEYAARAKSVTPYPWGTTVGDNRANCFSSHCGENYTTTSPAGSFPPNAFGLHDMNGNVWEWVEDCYDRRLIGTPSDGAAKRRCGTMNQVVRGGGFYDYASKIRSSNRSNPMANQVRYDIGFRIARDLDD